MKKVGKGKHRYELHVTFFADFHNNGGNEWSGNYEFCTNEPLTHENHTETYARWKQEFQNVEPKASNIRLSDPVSYAGWKGAMHL